MCSYRHKAVLENRLRRRSGRWFGDTGESKALGKASVPPQHLPTIRRQAGRLGPRRVLNRSYFVASLYINHLQTRETTCTIKDLTYSLRTSLLTVPAHCSHCCANMIDCSMPSPALCSTQSCTLRAIHGCLACCCYCWAKRASQIRWDGRLATAHVLQPSASPGPFHGTQDISSDVRLRRQSIRRS